MDGATSHTKKDAQTLLDIDKVLQDISYSEHAAIESRIRVYPRTPGATVRLTPDAAADTWGDWTQVIPAGTIRFPYHIVGVLVEDQLAADTWIGQFACSATPSGSEYMGEWRLRLGALGNFFPTVPLSIQGSGLPIGCAVYGRVMSAAAAANWVDVSVTLTRHFLLEKDVTPWPEWPWRYVFL